MHFDVNQGWFTILLWSLIAQGVILLAVIPFFRRGVVGELNALLRKIRTPRGGPARDKQRTDDA